MKVLSLFDGISCGRVALERAGLHVDKYYASEIEPHSIIVSKFNYPDIIHLGDIRLINTSKLDKIDLLIGGSPCQSFSFAGTRKGMTTKEEFKITKLEDYLFYKDLDFEFQGQSYLFWEFVRILKETNPKYFLLENVVMSKDWENVISETLGVRPILIDSKLVSAQIRKRLYWTNIPNVSQPEDKGIFLKDIISEKIVDPCNTFISGSFRDFLKERGIKSFKSCNGKVVTLEGPTYLANERRINKTRSLNNKSTCLTLSSISIAGSGGVGLFINGKHRKINRLECERLQTLPDGYTELISDNKAIQALGNGWTVDVIAHIFNHIHLDNLL